MYRDHLRVDRKEKQLKKQVATKECCVVCDVDSATVCMPEASEGEDDCWSEVLEKTLTTRLNTRAFNIEPIHGRCI
jgi:hypothetical protein